MIEILKESAARCQNAFHVGIQEPGSNSSSAIEHLHELKELTKTLGMSSSGQEMVVIKELHPQFFIGSGKAEAISEKAKSAGADCLVLDCELSPSQQRNWEKLANLPVLDRQEVIIDIFAERAITKEAVIQVELARLQYMLPRLARAWKHLSRQKGGAMGTRGEGEQQIEVDRRIVKSRIAHYKRELEQVKKNRDNQRKLRFRNGIPQAAIVGYTNAGKSSLLNRICGASVLVEDKLFATLDPTTRQIRLPDNRQILLTDTVGFIRKLPHTLVEAFKSTLEEASLADFLIHVVDVSEPYFEEHSATTLAVLNELGAGEKDMITVFNKTDLIDDPVLIRRLEVMKPGSIFISAKTGKGMNELLSAISLKASSGTQSLRVSLPPERQDLIALAHRSASITHSEYDEEGNLKMSLFIPLPLANKFHKYTI